MKGSLYVRGNNSTVSLLEMPWRPKFDKNPELHFDECIKANKVLLDRSQVTELDSCTKYQYEIGMLD